MQIGRRLAALALASSPSVLLRPPRALADKPYLDGSSRFALTVPDDFVVTSKRSAASGTLFVAGNFPRASVVSVTAWPLAELFQDDAKSRDLPGLPASPQSAAAMRLEGSSSLGDIGPAKEVANFLLRARDRDASSGALQSELLDSALSSDGVLTFYGDTELPVKDPDELEKQRGVRKLIRRTAAKAVLGTVPGATSGAPPVPVVFSCWASALTEDWDKDLKQPLEATLGSFSVSAAVRPAVRAPSPPPPVPAV